MKLVIAALALASAAYAACPNACSGHGTCESSRDACACYEGWTSADCSERLCPFGSAWVDLPQGDLDHDNTLDSGGPSSTASTFPQGVSASTSLNPQWRSTGWWERHPAQLFGAASDGTDLPFHVRLNEGHFYAECSGAGLCDRSSGICDCFPPFGGSACNRTVCPSDCSGHGLCRSIQERMPSSVDYYNLWDATKIHSCDCDGGWAGLDCSERQCPHGDDPLTTTTTRTDYNEGLAETGETQYVDVRCRHNGEIVNGMIALRYTDPVLMDTYETPFFELGNTSSTRIENYLKALPNNVLSDYRVDGTTVESKLSSVTVTELESASYFRIEVSFQSSFGDVPPISARAHPDFFCKNGVKVNTEAGEMDVHENIATYVVNDGPRRSLRYVIEVSDESDNSQDIFRYQVRDLSSNTVAALNADLDESYFVNHRPIDTTGSSDAEALNNAAYFHDDAAKVKFDWEYGKGDFDYLPEGASFTGRGGPGGARYVIDYITEPLITNMPKTHTLATGADAAIGNATATELDSADGAAENRGLIFGTPSADPTYDFSIEIIPLNHTSATNNTNVTMKISFNDEFVAYGYGDIPDDFGNILVFGANNLPTRWRGRLPTNGRTFVGPLNYDSFYTSNPGSISLEKELHRGWPGKNAVVVDTVPSDDDISVTYRRNQAPTDSFTIVLKFVSVSSSQDTYAWKLAGDPSWQDNNGAGFNVPAADAPTPLGGVSSYLSTYSDDEVRAQAAYIRLAWAEGPDNDVRTCDTTTRYYIHIGTDGLNDRPECANRGVCDRSSGLCNCFAGYTDPSCSTQSVLAASVSSSGAASA